jgi:hypothetical protein
MSNIPLINGVRHTFASIEIVLFGITLTGLKAISYKKKRTMTNEYGSGDEPDYRGLGNKEYEASITLTKYEVDRITAALPAGQDLTDIAPFNIPVVYKPVGASTLITDVIHNVQFTEMGVDTKQGDTALEIQLPLICAGITFNKR